MKKFYKLGIGLASATLCLAPLAQAQQDEKYSETTHAVAEDRKNREESPYEMGAITVTATRQEEKVLDTPAVVSVMTITSTTFRNWSVTSRVSPSIARRREPHLSAVSADLPSAV